MGRSFFPLSTAMRYFLTVARLGSITLATQELHVAGSAISRQLAQIESQLGVGLFVRKGRGMQLTDAGARLALQLQSSAETLERLIGQLGSVAGESASKVRLACTEGFAAGFVPSVIQRFRHQNPGVEFQLFVDEPDVVSRLVQRGQVDLALKYSVAPERGLRLHLSAADALHAVVRSGHPLAAKNTVQVAEVVQFPLLLPSAGKTGRQLFDWSCALQSLHYRLAVESSSSTAMLPLIGQQDVMLAGRITVAHLIASQALVAIAFEAGQMQGRHLQVLSADKESESPLVVLFREVLIDQIQVTLGRQA